MNSKKLSEKYDYFYKEAGVLFEEHNPCQFKDGKCVDNNSQSCKFGNSDGCCSALSCEHFGPGGCTVEALGCKFYTCFYVSRNYKSLYSKLVDLEKEFHKETGTFLLCFQSREQFLALNVGKGRRNKRGIFKKEES